MKKNFLLMGILLFSLAGKAQNRNSFSFVLTADMRNFTGDNPEYFRGACEAIAKHQNLSFMISPGDIDPPDSVYYTIQKYISKDMIWYPVVGNHEEETVSDMTWLRNYNAGGKKLPYIMNTGPESCKETNYSFDYKNTHFVILNQYATETCDTCTKGDVPDFLYKWLEGDLKATKKKNILVIGHEPAYPLPDMENQRFRHTSDCLNAYPANRDRFVKLLQDYGVKAYIFGHTHNYSVVKINRLWHVDVGHARGTGDMGAKSTYMLVNVDKSNVSFLTYRLNSKNEYELTDQGNFN